MTPIVAVNFEDQKWSTLWSRVKSAGMRITDTGISNALNKVLQYPRDLAKMLAPKKTGALSASITTKRVVYKKNGFVWGGIGVESKSMFATAGGKVKRPPNYYFILENGRVSDANRARNTIANRINPNRKEYHNRTSTENTKHPFLAPAIRDSGASINAKLYQGISDAVDRELAKAAV